MRPRVRGAHREVDSHGVTPGDGQQLRGVQGVDVEGRKLEEGPELGSESGEGLVDQLQL